MSKTVPVRIVVTACAVFILAVLHLPLAQGHDTVLEAVPAMDGTVSEFPRDIQLTFSGEPKPDFNTLAISNSDTGVVVYRATPEVSGRFVSVHVPDSVNPGAGHYKIGYQITSSDGHSTRGFTRFSVVGSREQRSSGEPSFQKSSSDEAFVSQDSAAEEPSTNKGVVDKGVAWILMLVGIAVLAVGVVVVSMLKRPSIRKGTK